MSARGYERSGAHVSTRTILVGCTRSQRVPGTATSRVWDIDQGLIATEAIRETMEQASEVRLIGEGFRQPARRR
jgi:hypothetical protein